MGVDQRGGLLPPLIVQEGVAQAGKAAAQGRGWCACGVDGLCGLCDARGAGRTQDAIADHLVEKLLRGQRIETQLPGQHGGRTAVLRAGDQLRPGICPRGDSGGFWGHGGG